MFLTLCVDWLGGGAFLLKSASEMASYGSVSSFRMVKRGLSQRFLESGASNLNTNSSKLQRQTRWHNTGRKKKKIKIKCVNILAYEGPTSAFKVYAKQILGAWVEGIGLLFGSCSAAFNFGTKNTKIRMTGCLKASLTHMSWVYCSAAYLLVFHDELTSSDVKQYTFIKREGAACDLDLCHYCVSIVL